MTEYTWTIRFRTNVKKGRPSHKTDIFKEEVKPDIPIPYIDRMNRLLEILLSGDMELFDRTLEAFTE